MRIFIRAASRLLSHSHTRAPHRFLASTFRRRPTSADDPSVPINPALLSLLDSAAPASNHAAQQQTPSSAAVNDTSSSSSSSRADGTRVVGRSKHLAKLSRPLETPVKRLPTAAERGHMDAHAEDVCEVLNDALSKSQLHGLFRGTGDASKYIEFTHVTTTIDASHTTAFWRSVILTAFANRVAAESGREPALDFLTHAESRVTSRLQSKEPLLRSLLCKQISFKRVPRLFFKPDPSQGIHIDSVSNSSSNSSSSNSSSVSSNIAGGSSSSSSSKSGLINASGTIISSYTENNTNFANANTNVSATLPGDTGSGSGVSVTGRDRRLDLLKEAGAAIRGD